MEGNSRIGIVVILVVLVALIAFSPITNVQAVEKIKFGSLMPNSGPLALPGMSWSRGFELGADFLNEQGGITINGKQYLFEIVAEDSQGSAGAARSSALKLIHKDGVKFILGGFMEPAIEAMNKVCEEAEVFYGAANANIPGHPADVSPDKPFQVRLALSHDDTQPIDLDYLKKHYPNAKKMAVVAPDIGYEPMHASLQVQAAERGFEIVHTEKWQWGTTDFIPVMTKVLASKPDVIFAIVSGQAQYQLQSARQLGFDGPFVSNSPLAAEVFFAVVGTEVCDKLIVNSINTVQTNEKVQEVIDRWAKKYKEPFITDGVQGYDAIWVMAQVLEKAQSFDAKKIVKTFESLTNLGDLMTCHGPSRMGGKERFGVNRVLMRPIAITHVLNGKIASTELFPPK